MRTILIPFYTDIYPGDIKFSLCTNFGDLAHMHLTSQRGVKFARIYVCFSGIKYHLKHPQNTPQSNSFFKCLWGRAPRPPLFCSSTRPTFNQSCIRPWNLQTNKHNSLRLLNDTSLPILLLFSKSYL